MKEGWIIQPLTDLEYYLLLEWISVRSGAKRTPTRLAEILNKKIEKDTGEDANVTAHLVGHTLQRIKRKIERGKKIEYNIEGL